MAKIYISYKLEEQDLARQFSQELERLGHRADYDVIASSPGGDWRQILREAMSTADAVVVLLSDRALGSPYIMGEIGAARALQHAFGHVILLPVLVGDIAIPEVVDDLFSARLQPSPEGIGRAAAEVARLIDDRLARTHAAWPRLFISHRHSDVAVVQALVKLLEATFELAPTDMRCTSVPPYKLKVGARTGDRLRDEIGRAEAVLGILTPDTNASSYVLFELGASWGRRGVTFPLLARGAVAKDIPAPIGDLHTLALSDVGECQQLLDDLADVTTLRRRTTPADQVSQLISELVALAQ